MLAIIMLATRVPTSPDLPTRLVAKLRAAHCTCETPLQAQRSSAKASLSARGGCDDKYCTCETPLLPLKSLVPIPVRTLTSL
eukprot:CAMPEP_0173415604 /NCGR_PEP_ID=MMETSP1356-20130122/84949_1 /TAXON_ID=77927 ORGANISM="Hemiselmis virescens, Strain PCC157" /NCGR_SAMPLE_ID=MMETSP1356 /ASSEMBLY_ACC=CAM_ASM_000847 /LENGTH=81 /DNA_ID=CAMNT_0014377859 /DNA_START=772 /DNA_END=1017 /DNA_ORIENTATION=+